MKIVDRQIAYQTDDDDDDDDDDDIFTPSRLLSKKDLEQAFSYVFFHSRPFNEKFIVNGKSYCCIAFTDVRFTSLLVKSI